MDPSSVAIGETGCTMALVHSKSKEELVAEVHAIEGNMFRVKIKEKEPMRERYEVEGALIGEPKVQR